MRVTDQPLPSAEPLTDEEAFRFGQFSIDRWLKRVPGGYLAGTEHGQTPGRPLPDLVRQEGPLQHIYLLDLALFLGAERAGVLASAGLARIAPDEESLLFLASQVLDEARHFEAFAVRLRALGVDDGARDDLAAAFMPASYRAFLDSILEAVDKGDFEAGLIGLSVILEGMAFPLYEYEVRYWQPFDPGLAEVVHGAYLDECRHVGFGEKRLAWQLRRDPRSRRRLQRVVDDYARALRASFQEFLTDTVTYYDLAVRDHPELCSQVEILPGKSLLETSTEEQVRWLEAQIEGVHRKRLARMGLEVNP
jgi:hypothetical protein